MAQWGSKDNKDSAPVYVVDATTGHSGTQEYGNTVFRQTPDNVEPGLSSPGWVRVVHGKGKITALDIVDGGSGYNPEADTITIDDQTHTFTVDDKGKILTVDYKADDQIISKIPEIKITSETGSGAVLKFKTSGRIGRVQTETLVAIRSKPE